MSSGSETPSFGDLFDDPDDSGSASTAVDDHDLDHESSEATHMVAGFEPAAEPDSSEPEDAAEPVAVHAGSVSVSATGTVAAVAADEATTRAARSEVWDGSPDPALSATPADRIDTGRLYRSSGAEGPATLDAIPALDPARLARLSATSTATADAAATPRPTKTPKTPKAPKDAREPRPAGAGLTYSGVVVIVGAATLTAGFIEALLRHQLGWLTGIALLVSSVYCALMVRKPDAFAAVFVPPLAFLVTALTAGMLTLDSSGGLLSRVGFGLFRNLATNAPWILGTTLVCLAIVLVRRTRD